MENYENKELLKDAAKKSLESLKDLKPVRKSTIRLQTRH